MEPSIEHARFSRRAMALGALAWLGCGRSKGTRFPGYLVVANRAGRSVAAVDLSAFAVARRTTLSGAPGDMLAHRELPLVYVEIPELGTVWEMDVRSLRVKRSARLTTAGPGTRALGMKMDPRSRSLWVLTPSSLVELPLDTFRPSRGIRLPGEAVDFDLGAEGRIAVTLRDREAVVLAAASGRIEHRIPLSAPPAIVRFRADEKQVLISHEGERSLTVADVEMGRAVVRLPLPLEPRHFCFKPDGGELFVTGDGLDAVVIVDPYHTQVTETVLAGRSPDAMTVSSALSYLLVANPNAGTVTILDFETRKLVATVPVGEEPRRILLTPDSQYALVLNRRSGDVAVIRVAALAGRRYRTWPPPLFTMIPVGAEPAAAAVVRV